MAIVDQVDSMASRTSVLDRLSQGQQIDPREKEAVDRLSMNQMGEFEKGLRRFGYSAASTTEAFVGGVAEPFAPQFAKRRLAGAVETMQGMPESLRPRYETFDQAREAGDYAPYVAGALGEGLGSVGTMVAAGLLTRGAAFRAGAGAKNAAQFAGGTAAMLPMEGGETALRLRENPEAMANTTPEQRAGLTLGRGTVNAALENVVPQALFMRQLAGQGARIAPGLRSGAANIGRKFAAGTLGEAATEGAQDLTGQYAENLAAPGTGYDLAPTREAAIRGGITGGVLGGAGGIAQGVYSNTGAAVDKAVEEVKSRKPLDALVSTTYDVINNPANVAEDLTNMTMGALAEAKTQLPEYAGVAKEQLSKGVDIAGEAMLDAEMRLSQFILDNVEPENQAKYMEMRTKLKTMTVGEYRILRDQLEAETGKKIPVATAIGKGYRGAKRGAKGFADWTREVYRGAARAMEQPAEGVKQSVDVKPPAYTSEQMDELAELYGMLNPNLNAKLKNAKGKYQVVEFLNAVALNPTSVPDKVKKAFTKATAVDKKGGVHLDKIQRTLTRMHGLYAAGPESMQELRDIFSTHGVADQDRAGLIGLIDREKSYADLDPPEKRLLTTAGKNAIAQGNTYADKLAQLFYQKPYADLSSTEKNKLQGGTGKAPDGRTLAQIRGEEFYNTVVKGELEGFLTQPADARKSKRERQVESIAPQRGSGVDTARIMREAEQYADPEKLASQERTIVETNDLGEIVLDEKGRTSPYDEEVFRGALRAENMERKLPTNKRTKQKLRNSIPVELSSDRLTPEALAELIGYSIATNNRPDPQQYEEGGKQRPTFIQDEDGNNTKFVANINLKSLWSAIQQTPEQRARFEPFLPEWSEDSATNQFVRKQDENRRRIATISALDGMGLQIDPETLPPAFLRAHGLVYTKGPRAGELKNPDLINVTADVDVTPLIGEGSNVLINRQFKKAITFPEVGFNYGSSPQLKLEALRAVMNDVRTIDQPVLDILEAHSEKLRVQNLYKEDEQGNPVYDDEGQLVPLKGEELKATVKQNRRAVSAQKLIGKMWYEISENPDMTQEEVAQKVLNELTEQVADAESRADKRTVQQDAQLIAAAITEGDFSFDQDFRDLILNMLEAGNSELIDHEQHAVANQEDMLTALSEMAQLVDMDRYVQVSEESVSETQDDGSEIDVDADVYTLNIDELTQLMNQVDDTAIKQAAKRREFENSLSGTVDTPRGTRPGDKIENVDWDAEYQAVDRTIQWLREGTERIGKRKGEWDAKAQADAIEALEDIPALHQEAAAARHHEWLNGKRRKAINSPEHKRIPELQRLQKYLKGYNDLIDAENELRRTIGNSPVFKTDEDRAAYIRQLRGRDEGNNFSAEGPAVPVSTNEAVNLPAQDVTLGAADLQIPLLSKERLTRFETQIRKDIRKARASLEKKMEKQIANAETVEKAEKVEKRVKARANELPPKRAKNVREAAKHKVEDLKDPEGAKDRAAKRYVDNLSKEQKRFREVVETMLGGRVAVLFDQNLSKGVNAQYEKEGRTAEEMEESRTNLINYVRTPVDQREDNEYLEGLTDDEILAQADQLEKLANAKRLDKTIQGVIRVASGMEQKAGLAEHEAFHGAFKLLFQHRPQDRRTIATAFTAGQAGRRLREIFKDDPAVLAVIDPKSKKFDAEEAAAYGYQVWATNPQALKLGEKGQGVFEKIKAVFRAIFNILTPEEKANMMLRDLRNGVTAETGITAMQRYQARDRNAKDHLVEGIKALGSAASYFTDTLLRSTYSRMMDTENPALAQIARLGYVATGEEGGAGFIQRQRMETTARLNELGKILKDLGGEEAVQAMHEAHIAGVDEGRSAELDKFLRDLLEYQKEAGVTLNDAGERYYPLPWDPEKVMNNQEAFVAMLEKYQDQMAAVHNGRLANTPMQIWDNIAQYGERGETFTDITEGTAEPSADHTGTRYLAMITPEDRRPFMRDNADEVLTHYVQQAVRNAEYVRAYGHNSQKLKKLMNEARSVYGMTPEEEALANDYVDGLLGNKGQGMSRELKDTYGALTLYQNVRLLPFATFSSLVDPLGIAVRTGDGKAAFDAFTYSMKNLFRDWRKEYKPDEWEQIATDMGYIEASGTPISTDARYTGITLRGKTRAWNDAFFRLNLLNGLVRNHHIMATKAADKFLLRASENFFGEETSARYLAEVGIDPDQVVYSEALQRNLLTEEEFANAGFSTEVGENGEPSDAAAAAAAMRSAMGTIVRQSLISPSSAEMPGWMSNPYLAPIAHLKSFVFGFNKTIIERLTHEAAQGNSRPLLYAAAYVPGMIAADFAKDMVNHMGDEPEYKKNWGMADYLKQGVYRSGLTGAGQFFTDAGNDMSRGGYGIESFLGPTFEQGRDWKRVWDTGSGERFWSETVDALPANAIYDQWIDP